MPPRDDLRGVDLALLAILKELLDSESVTIAARRLGSTQPNVSRSLARLRLLFGDPLLVPVGRGMQKTPRARELQPRLENALEGMRLLLSSKLTTQPNEVRGTVRIAASDYATAVVLHPWIARLRREAPGVIVQIEPLHAGTIDPLAQGELDLAVAPRLPVTGLEQFVFRRVLSDRMVCVLRKDHPSAKKRLTLRRYLSLEHVMVGALLPPVSSVQLGLHRLGKTRRVALRVPSFLSALHAVLHTDLAAAVPERLVQSTGLDVVEHSLPFEVEAVSLNLVWHPRRTMDAQHRWIREGILAAQ